MTVIAARPGWPAGRLALSLLFSLLLHWLIVEGWQPSGGPRSVAGPPPLQARLEIPAPGPALSSAGEPAVEPGNDRKLASAARYPHPESRVAPAQPPSIAQPAGSTGPDLRFYTARELDRYPVPLVPLKPVAVDGRAGLRFWLGIDATGIVVEVTPGDGGGQGVEASRAREILLATRFEPAFKDGKPVRSRVLLALE
jgi:hypothetical protein